MRLVVGCGLLVASIGCDSRDKWEKARPPVYPGIGQVLFNGKPVAGAKVNFHPVTGTHSAFGVTDDNGEFSLTTFNPEDGAIGGEHEVSVSKRETYIVRNPENPEILPPLVYEEYSLLPERYGAPEESGLTATVAESDDNTYLFELEGEVPPLPDKVPASVLE